ncbi:hypothetical protein HYU40_02340 [Candidatus Woesearchaeota archaeon]|nr:hypothetical protein [Candidatus Woesearchaeota archaeon]
MKKSINEARVEHYSSSEERRKSKRQNFIKIQRTLTDRIIFKDQSVFLFSMRSIQWFLIGIFLIVMGIWFIKIDMTWALGCNILDDSSTLNKADIVACVNGEILDPFIWLLFPLGVVFNICGWIEAIAEKREKR